MTNGFGLGAPIDFAPVAAAAWLGLPNFSEPVFEARAVILIAPAAMMLVAEILDTSRPCADDGRDLHPYMGRAFIGDGVETIIAGAAGSPG